MGVKGLWKLIEESGTPVPLESLEHKILAVDVSIWLHQAVRGFRGIGGDAVANSHLLTLFHRICKLLFYRIRPVFVFDGGVPHLKKQTLSFRRVRREAAASRAQKVRERLLTNLLKSHAVRSALGRSGPTPTEHRVLPAPKPVQKDMFELPPLPEGVSLGAENDIKVESSDDSEAEDQPKKKKKIFHYKNIHSFDVDSDEFKSLPLQKRHEVLVELQGSRKDNSWATINEMPIELSGFSSYQMDRLLKRWKFQETVDDVRNAIQKEKSDELEQELFGDLEKHVSQTHRIASEDAAHSVVLRTVCEEEKEAPAKTETNVDKGKSLMKRSSKDFLTELKNQGFLHPYSSRNDDSDNDDQIDNSSDNELIESVNVDEKDPLLHVMNYVMEDNNGLSQEEILSLIQQSSDEVDKSTLKPTITDQPCTSKNASGIVANPDISSESDSDTDDFVEVPECDDEDLPTLATCVAPKPPALPSSDVVGFANDNMEAIRASNSSSLYIKIVQHRLDDIMQKNDTSPKKAITDTRKVNNTNGSSDVRLLSTKRKLVDNTETSNGFTLTIDINKTQKIEDDLFADVFSTQVLLNKDSDTVTEPRSKPKHDLAKATKRLDNKRKGESITPAEQPPEAPKRQSVGKKMKIDNSSVEITSELQDKVNELVKKQVDEMLKNATLPLNAKHDIARLINENCQKNVMAPVLPANDPDVMDSDIDDDLHEAESCDEDTSHQESLKADSVQENSGKMAGVSSKLNLPNEKSSTGNTAKGNVALSEDHVAKRILPSSRSTLQDTVASATDELPSEDSTASEGRDELVQEASAISKHGELQNNLTPISSDKSSSVELSSQLESQAMQKNSDDLKKIESELVNEQKSLVAQAQQGDRVASNLSQQMYTDAQDLLQLFGLPYLVAPMEAEAQCAFLDEVGLTHGTITDDSDAFLFGSKHVYKNFFNQNQHVELFKLPNIEAKFGLDREKLITLALLTGSDYTEGIEGIGAVSGMEVLTEFPGKGVQVLINFKRWWNAQNQGVSAVRMSKIREKLAKAYLPEGFPNEAVYNAYTAPIVDESREKFCWSVPNVDALREFTAEKLGWCRSKTDEILVPVMKRMSVNSTQTRIDTFFNNIRLVKEPKTTSKRLQEAIAKSKGEIPSQSSPTKENLMDKIRKEQETKRKTKCTKASEPSKVSKTLLLNDLPQPVKSPNIKGKQNQGKTQSAKGKSKPKSLQESKMEVNAFPIDQNNDATPPVILTKEEQKVHNYKKLLEHKEEIAQKKTAEADMNAKKQQAALLLKSQVKTKKR